MTPVHIGNRKWKFFDKLKISLKNVYIYIITSWNNDLFVILYYVQSLQITISSCNEVSECVSCQTTQNTLLYYKNKIIWDETEYILNLNISLWKQFIMNVRAKQVTWAEDELFEFSRDLKSP